ncbi:MAG: FkbM family methyltransferase [Pseudomonadota bacterium]
MKLTPAQKVTTLFGAMEIRQKLKNILIYNFWAKRKTWEQHYGGVPLTFDTSDFYSNWWFYGFKNLTIAHEPVTTRLVIELAKKSTCFLDLGANLGYFSVLAKKTNPSIDVLGFEMDETLDALIKRNMALNGVDGIDIVFGAVGDGGDPLAYQPHPYSFLAKAYGEFDRAPKVELKAPIHKIDEVLAEKGLTPDLVKVDIDGGEAAGLRAATGMLENPDLVMLLELHPILLAEIGESVEAIDAMLTPYGFDYYEIDDYRDSQSITLTRKPNVKDLGGAGNPMFVVTRKDPAVLLETIKSDLVIR